MARLDLTRPLALAVALASLPAAGSAGAADAPDAAGPRSDVVLFDRSGLGRGWLDYGWSPHELVPGAPARLDLSGYGGLILARPGLSGTFAGVSFRYLAPVAFGDFLEVRLEDAAGAALARPRVGRDRGRPGADGFAEVFLPMRELNPQGRSFERVVFHAWRSVGPERVLLADVVLRATDPRTLPARAARFALRCDAPARPISPLIYGIAGSADEPDWVWASGASARRWGGNPTSRYNWELGNAWSTNHDWFFRNARVSPQPGFTSDTFLEANRAHGVKTALTVPMLGWVAKDVSSYSFPVSVFGPQQATARELPDAGNGVAPDGKPLPPGPPTRTSLRSTPGSIERWVRSIRERDRARGRGVHQYILDNEPGLWHETHRDVHPEPVGYDELLERTLAYAAAIRRADPDAVIAGPAAWGWLEYHFSARDKVAGTGLRPDRLIHGNVPLLPWYLRKVREHERRTGVRLLDLVDVHFYPAAPGVGIGTGGDTGPAGAALRLRSTRSLWDPSYVDESWVLDRMRVLPLLRSWIDENAPGLGISIGEWNFGAEQHMSGGLAVAEVLGRFALEGITSAFYWTYPPDRSPAFWAFRAYRNYDGAGGRLLDLAVPTDTDTRLASLFASRDAEGRRFVAVLLNLDDASPLEATLDLERCGPVSRARTFTYGGGDGGFSAAAAEPSGKTVGVRVDPYTINVVEIEMGTQPRRDGAP